MFTLMNTEENFLHLVWRNQQGKDTPPTFSMSELNFVLKEKASFIYSLKFKTDIEYQQNQTFILSMN